jgi:hypothetical protein
MSSAASKRFTSTRVSSFTAASNSTCRSALFFLINCRTSLITCAASKREEAFPLAAREESPFPDDDDRQMYLDMMSMSLDGTRTKEDFFIHTGNGGNGKGMMKLLMYLVFGKY